MASPKPKPLIRADLPEFPTDHGPAHQRVDGDVIEFSNGQIMVPIAIYVEPKKASGYGANAEDYFRDVNIQAPITGTHLWTFERIRNACRTNNCKLVDGRPVHTNADVLRHILEMVETQLDGK